MVQGLALRKDLIEKLRKRVNIVSRTVTTGPLVGRVYCFTGIRDKEAEQKLEDLGAKVTEGFNKSVTHLVALNPNGRSGKLEKARSQGQAIIGLEDLKTELQLF